MNGGASKVPPACRDDKTKKREKGRRSWNEEKSVAARLKDEEWIAAKE